MSFAARSAIGLCLCAALAGVSIARAGAPTSTPSAVPTTTPTITATIGATPTATPTTTRSATATATPATKPASGAAPAPASAPQPAARNTAAVGAGDHVLAGASSPVNPDRTPGVMALLRTTDGSERDPGNWTVRVHKSQHRLDVFYKGFFYRSYRAVFGRNLDTSAKVFAGDRRTPEGNYLIISKYPNRRWRYFLKLNYPNMIDISRFEELRAAHEIPTAAGNAGGAIGIHGTDVPMLNDGNINWTTGCISVNNSSIDELEALLPVGTLVVIKP